jgi:hypothetical protein
MKKIIVLAACVAICNIVGATPFKNLWATLETTNTGAGVVYISSDDPHPRTASVVETSTEIQCTITEDNNAYPITLHAIANEGWTFVGFTNVRRDDGNYQNSDFVSRDNPAKVYVTLERSTDTMVGIGASDEELEAKRDEARQKEPWPEVADAHFYAVFAEESNQKLLEGLTQYADCQLPDGSGSLGTIVQPEIIHEGDEVTAVGVPNPGCSFVKWTDAAGKTVTTNPSLEFVATEGVAYTAHFKLDAITVDDNLMCSFSATKAVDMRGREDVRAYIVISADDDNVVMKQVDFVPHNAGVLVCSAESGSYELNTKVQELDERNFLAGCNPSFYSENLLKGCGATAAETDGTFYVLANKSQGLGFYRLKWGERVPAGKAYLKLSSNERDFIAIDIQRINSRPDDSETTVVGNATNSQKKIGALYNMKGQRVKDTYKGVVVQNGRRIIQR